MDMFNIIKLTDFAEKIGIPESTVRTWRRRKDIPAECFKVIGSTVFVRVKEMQEWLDKVA